MTTYPNQKTCLVRREMPQQSKNNKRPYMIAYIDNMRKAMQNISRVSSYKLYTYLLGNTDGYHFAISTKDIAEECGISIDSAQDAVKDLIKKGYLVLINKNNYEFHETPIENIKPVEEIKKKFERANGEIEYMSFNELVVLCGGDEEKAMENWRITK